ncbi:hypothetical protein BDN70DRAFT_937308 [Pholiota conissans]|uniref:Zinc finger PHD-type domain-containing protein n=1 Tax=Pholiota conissans TaxID=109636 RepID=A0A9P5YRW8_9AGAR|nr:hypothetical protein BDN70DRAFT_937308 [Pholiota conissans]
MAKKKKNPKQPGFEVDSTQYCESCKLDVLVGFGGEKNWEIHASSAAHQRAIREAEVIPKKNLFSFFGKVKIAVTPTITPTTVAAAPLLLPPTPSSLTAGVSLFTQTTSASSIISCPATHHNHTLLQDLLHTIQSLPTSIPVGLPSDDLGALFYSPKDLLQDGEDAWEDVINPTLDRLLGFGIDSTALQALIRRGDFGMDGVYRYFKTCICELSIDAGLLEGKIGRLIEAMVVLGSTRQASTSDTSKVISQRTDNSCIIIDSPTPSPPRQSSSTSPYLRLATAEVDSPCPGYQLIFPDNKSPFESYPFLLHTKCTLPWTLVIDSERLTLYSTRCTHIASVSIKGKETKPQPCSFCKQLELDQTIMGIRAIGIRNQHIQTWKRLAMAIGNSDIPRLRALTYARVLACILSWRRSTKQRRDNTAQKATLKQILSAVFLIYKLGGHSAAIIAQRALGAPSIDATKRHVSTAPLQPSPGFPTLNQLMANLRQCYLIANEVALGMSIQLDELKVQERLRWEPRTNHILGLCREHCKPYALEFRSITQAEAIAEALHQKRVHLATEATVIGASILDEEPSKYVTKPFAMSGSCKRESLEDQEKLISLSVAAVKDMENSLKTKLYCVCSDGDLVPGDSIYTTLSSLPLFNLKCGDDFLTADFDWKHVLKRFRNTAIRQKGFSLHGRAFSTSVLREHLKSLPMTDLTIDALLSPNDKQDVVLMIKLLYSISQLSSAPPTASPLTRSTREMLRLLGHLYGNLLSAYMDVSLSLHEQLVKLSTAAHLILALYNLDKGNFIPVQSYFDVMCMIKNVYFCVAKAQRDDPEGRFYIILLGTDGLEKVFGKVRSMIGNDTNADVLQLANRIDGAVKCVNILERHPEWGGDARRLKVKPLNKEELEITSKYDHLNPATFTGDLSVGSVVLLGSWNDGRRLAEEDLRSFGIAPPFEQMEVKGGYDMLCPFGNGNMVLVGDTLESGERNETAEERDEPITPTSTNPLLTTDPVDNDALNPDLDDLANMADASANSTSGPPPAYVQVDSNNPSSKSIHKSSILRLYSSPLTINESRDRLKRVRGYSRYNEVKSDTTEAIAPGSDSEDTLDVQDPAFVLVHCDKSIFLAVLQILGIRRDGKDVSSIPSRLLTEPSIRLQGQIMKLSPILLKLNDPRIGNPDVADWEWNGNFESCGRASRGRNKGEDTYVFKTSELRAVAAVMHERLSKENLPKVAVSGSFPYRTENGDACFVCERDEAHGDLRHVETLSSTCSQCPNIKIDAFTGQDLLKHMGAHILNDPNLRGADNPCGLCLNTGQRCKIFLSQRAGTISIDQVKSHCPNLRSLSIKKAEEFSERQPCTNHPLLCPLCPRGSMAIWKYNLTSHISLHHPSSNVALYEAVWCLHADEPRLMEAEWDKLKRLRLRPTIGNPLSATRLKLSEGHSSRLALRTLAAKGVDPAQSIDNSRDLEALPSPRYDHTLYSTPLDAVVPDPWEPPSRIASPELEAAISDFEQSNHIDEISEAVKEDGIDAQWEATGEGTQDTEVEDMPLDNFAAAPGNSGLRHRQKRKYNIDNYAHFEDDQAICQDNGCGRAVADNELLLCKGPGCGGRYHLTCRGLSRLPTKDWYCDNDCKANATGSSGRKRRRRKA